MCQGHKCLISFAVVCGLQKHEERRRMEQQQQRRRRRKYNRGHQGLCVTYAIQSALWIASGLTGALVYLCIIPINPYENSSDFFRVTFVKLYFEGPNCIPNGTYLGKFNEDYRTKIDLFTPDKVFSIMTAYVILNAVYFILSISFYNSRKEQEKRNIALGWSGITLVLCAVDVVLTAESIFDVINLRNYMKGSEILDIYASSARGVLNDVSYLPLVLALVSSRFVVGWLWNFLVGITFFLDALCCRQITGKPIKQNKKKHDKRHDNVEELCLRTEERATSVSMMNGKYYNAFDDRSNPDYLNFRKSWEAVTNFNRAFENSNSRMEKPFESKTSNGAYSDEPHSSKDWERTNEGYVNDEENPLGSAMPSEHDHNLNKSESELGENKIEKLPIGKPVSIPLPPPLQIKDSCDC